MSPRIRWRIHAHRANAWHHLVHRGRPVAFGMFRVGSGGGKSSPLSAIAGIVAYTGRIAWNGEDLASVPVHRRGMGLGDRAATEVSRGQRQRVALARSLAVSPRVLLLAEPLSSLDAEMRDILKARGTTTILVTHDEAEAKRIATRVVRIDAGALQPL